LNGKIKTILRDKGFGFISVEDGNDVFFHRSGLDGIEFEALTEGSDVEFDMEQGPKGPRAANIKIV
jgi:cold shock protein